MNHEDILKKWIERGRKQKPQPVIHGPSLAEDLQLVLDAFAQSGWVETLTGADVDVIACNTGD